MSMVRIVTRIIPRDARAESVSCLLRPDQIDVPVRTTSSDGGPSCDVVTETTFCRAVAVPADCPDPDVAAASGCEGIPGLSCLKKSRLRRVTEEAGGSLFRVVPEVAPDGSCTGMLLSIPLRIPRSEFTTDPDGDRTGTRRHFQAAFSVARTVDGFPLQQERNQNLLQTALPVTHDDWHGEKCVGSLPNNGEPTNDSVDFSALEKAVEPLRGYFQGERCLLCGFVCSGDRWSEVATRHLSTHLDSGQSSGCKKPFGSCLADPPNRQKKSEVPLFTCDQCGKKFRGKKRLVVHTKKVHGEGGGRAGGVRCPFCDAHFESGKRLKGHMSVQHAGQLPHECGLCGERFRTADTLRDHSTQHRRERRFGCGDCGKGFHRRALLRGHRSSVHGSQ